MPAGCRDLQSPARTLLSADVGEIKVSRLGLGLRPVTVARRVRLGLCLAPYVRGSLGQVPDGNRLDAAQSSLGRRWRGAEQALEPGPTRSLCDGKNASDWPQPPVQAELTHCSVPTQAVPRELSRSNEDGECDRQIEPGSLLPKPGGSEVDRDTPHRPLQLRRCDPAANAVLRFLAGTVSEADDREPRHAPLEVGFHFDASGIEPDDCERDRAREHAFTLGGQIARVRHIFVTCHETRRPWARKSER